jgi:hypothetical protein
MLDILDFSKAFDTVPHNKLLHKLHQYGIKGKIHKWLTNFLTARSMRTIVEGEKSNEITVDYGVHFLDSFLESPRWHLLSY